MMRKGPKPTDVRTRFWPKVQIGISCWYWIGSRNQKGYGKIVRDRRFVYAHRLAWELFFGPIPPGLEVMHRCDTPSCVNPAHLMVGTHQANMMDASNKGRLRNNGNRNGQRDAAGRFADKT